MTKWQDADSACSSTLAEGSSVCHKWCSVRGRSLWEVKGGRVGRGGGFDGDTASLKSGWSWELLAGTASDEWTEHFISHPPSQNRQWCPSPPSDNSV